MIKRPYRATELDITKDETFASAYEIAKEHLGWDSRRYVEATELAGAITVYWFEQLDGSFRVLSLKAPNKKVLLGLEKHKLEIFEAFRKTARVERLLLSTKHNPLTVDQLLKTFPGDDKIISSAMGDIYIVLRLGFPVEKDWFYIMPHPFFDSKNKKG
ncbi:hypothetical protein H6G17_18265 [Chroococcidiopsis sp. FACHB-1243]|uniref:hypothetical protein n=1 Tax=Chroococcidiopsis sp. [FACHB-1243] TaxID=2692781 RepID=UPI001785B3C2|nr:hypothetical protein [Chroococcidiopsis sp. [FACHB-1243]]MBD2307422.1 hypothetical protein [Chroococcidiopsis sp. [FACHB-1243]]